MAENEVPNEKGRAGFSVFCPAETIPCYEKQYIQNGIPFRALITNKSGHIQTGKSSQKKQHRRQTTMINEDGRNNVASSSLNPAATAGPLKLNETGTDKKWIGPSKKYEVPMITLNDPANRPLKVITIGGGVSGIMMAYKIQELTQNVEHIIYERNASIGGTWFENRYPGCACDVPSHGYTYPWAPNPEWPRFLSHSKDILEYLHRVVDTVELGKYINVNCQVAEARWNEDRGKWRVKIQRVEPKSDWSSTTPLKILSEFYDEADILLHATGILNRWDYPSIPGLDRFRGRVVHTAGWPDNYGEEQWKNENVVVIGSGASSVQTVPTMQPHVKHMDVFVRTPVWFVQILDNFGNNHEYSEEDRKVFRRHPEQLVAHIKEMENGFNARFDQNIVGHPAQTEFRKMVTARMRDFIKEDKIFEGILPDFPVNCRRMTPGDPYMSAIQQENVSMRFTGVARVTEDGAVGEDGIEVKCDTIVCATGFDASWRPRFPVIGRNNVNLQDKWKDAAEAYFGLACPDMPNWITFLGPNWPVAAGSVMGALDANGDYAIKCIKKMQNELIKSFCPKQSDTDLYNEHTQTWATKVVWGQNCRSWYKDNDTGRLRAVYAGSVMHYRELIDEPRWEDMDIEYLNKHNKYAFMGIGRHMVQSEEGRRLGLDPSPYCSLERVDPRVLREMRKGVEGEGGERGRETGGRKIGRERL